MSGIFDLIRIHDDKYKNRILKPDIWRRIIRNLELIKEKDLIMDFNLRALSKGASEPYISSEILKQVKSLNIPVVPGDDSHGIDDVGIKYGARHIHLNKSRIHHRLENT